MISLLLPAPFWAPAQNWGSLSGGLESTSVLYSDSSLRSNNYLKLDYVKGRFSAGLQTEFYPEPLLGYDVNLKGIGLPEKYIAWKDSCWSITAGDFYDQLGTGILLRSWEDRDLGWNNSMGGVRMSVNTIDNTLSFKLLGGFRRQYMWYSQDKLAAAVACWRLGDFSLEGSALFKHDGKTPSFSYGAMSSYADGNFSAKAEWVGTRNGNAQYLELGYAMRRFSSSLTLRRLQNMHDPMGMNYLPSLCQEQSYMLATLNPYTTFEAGEIGGNADIFFRHKSWKVHLNGALVFSLPCALENYDVCRMAYRDVNIEVEKRWGRRMKTVAYVSIQENSPSHGDRKATVVQNVFVLDGVYKTKGRISLRAQAQYLYSQELTKDWMAILLELSSTSGWSFHAKDMYNHGSSGEHYYEFGASWTKEAFKIDLSYGHQRAGLVCSGGVCRWQPEFTGALLRLKYQFQTKQAQ